MHVIIENVCMIAGLVITDHRVFVSLSWCVMIGMVWVIVNDECDLRIESWLSSIWQDVSAWALNQLPYYQVRLLGI